MLRRDRSVRHDCVERKERSCCSSVAETNEFRIVSPGTESFEGCIIVEGTVDWHVEEVKKSWRVFLFRVVDAETSIIRSCLLGRDGLALYKTNHA